MSLCYGIVAALTDRTVVVTGGSSGIGRAIAVRCAAEGARVLAVGRDEDALAETEAAGGGRITPHRADLADPGAPEAVITHALSELGGLDGVVHAAGTVRRGEDFRDTEDAWLDGFLEVNLTAGMRIAREALRPMLDTGRGSIVLVGSQLAHVAQPGYASYAAAKGGLTAFARALAVDAGPLGVRVNVLVPGVVTTPLAYVDRPGWDEIAPSVAERLPLRRIGTPEDMAGPAVFLLSDDSAWMTGQTLIVDGGFTIQ
jgi:NAD(P)-dependent dehydrogenase (short-subunit alcohol dehydrogenase family)